jgi:hypothetical protein
MPRLARAAVLLLLLAALPARADVVLNGNFHVGDEDDKTEFTPLDPVDCTKLRTYPQIFNLSEAAMITGFTLHDALDTQNSTITVDLDGTQRSALSCTACDLCEGTASCGDITVTLTTGVALSAGDHSVAVLDPSGASGNCLSSNDFGWSKLTLLSTASTTSVMLSQRRHLGDDDDADDDYDFTGNVTTSSNQFYPDADEASFIDLSFTLPIARRLTDVMFYRMRDINSTNGTVQIDGTQIATLTTTGNPLTISTSQLLASGTHTLRVTSGTLLGLRDDFSWDATILRFTDAATAGTPGFFNAVDVGDNLLTGQIETKIAGGTATLDLYALDGAGTSQLTTYVGTTTVEVLDASNSSGSTDVYGCNSAWTSAQTLSAATVFVAGKATIAATWLTAGLKEARIRVTDNSTGARGCSLDNFAIRPASLLVAPSHATETTAGTTEALTNAATSGTPRHRAGRPFTITITAKTALGTTVTNYDGTPQTATGTAVLPATVNGDLGPMSWGTASGGSRRTDEATYDEVGAVTIKLEDTTWANVDADDTAADDRKFSGTAVTGRFVPDHFKVEEGTLAPACTNGTTGFSYLGSTLAWASPAVTLTAENAANETTQNYTQPLLMKLSSTEIGTPTYSAAAGTLGTLGVGYTLTTPAAGQVAIDLPDLQFARTLTGAFDADIEIGFPDFLGDQDGIQPLVYPLVLGASGGVGFTGGFKSQRFGRLHFEPRYGSELMPIDVPLRAEYFDGVAFVANTIDTCTSLSTASVTFAGMPGQVHTLSGGNGLWSVHITAPNPVAQGTATVSIDLASPPVSPTVPYPLLQDDDTDADANYDDDPVGTATFGVHAQDERWIYQRETTAD